LEVLTPEEFILRKVRRVLVWEKTEYQDVAVVELEGFGKTLVINGKTQSTRADERVYHEVLVHPAMVLHGSPTRVLIIGGGEGATLREVLRYKSVREAIMVDIDERVVEFSRKYLDEWHEGSFDDPRARAVFMDGREYVERAVERGEEYDVVVLDLVDPVSCSPALKLYTLEFYTLVSKLLGSSGVMVTQAASPIFYPRVFYSLAATISRVFRATRPYWAYIRSFGGMWGFVVASQTKDAALLTPSEVDSRLKRLLDREKGSLAFYDGIAHQGLFGMYKNIREELARQHETSTDESPVYGEY